MHDSSYMTHGQEIQLLKPHVTLASFSDFYFYPAT